MRAEERLNQVASIGDGRRFAKVRISGHCMAQILTDGLLAKVRNPLRELTIIAADYDAEFDWLILIVSSPDLAALAPGQTAPDYDFVFSDK